MRFLNTVFGIFDNHYIDTQIVIKKEVVINNQILYI